MNSKSFKVISVCALVLALGILFLQTNKSAAPETGTDLQAEKNTPPAMVFQPDSQILSDAINPKLEAASILASTKKNEPPEKPAASVKTAYAYNKNACAGESKSCFQAYYKDLVRDYGVDATFSDIKIRYNENPIVASDCHPLMHIIGQEASNRYATVSEAYLHGDSFCWSGYFHGIMEGVVAKIGIEKLPAKLDSICADIPGKAEYNFNYYNCVHGLGHGIMESLADEVPKSLTMCDNLTGDWEKSSCYGGVFMENIIINSKGLTSKYLKKDDPLYPCNSVDTKYKYQCYLGQTSYALEVSGYNFKPVFDLCATVESPFRDVCNQSMGRDAANQARYNAVQIKTTCSIPNDAKDRENCVIGAVKDMISYYHSKTQADNFCAILSENEKAVCSQTADAYYKLF
jgi:hypothetical protein